MEFRERLRDEMDYQGVSAKDLSDFTGISKRTIDNYLKTNPQEPGVVNAQKIAKALKVSVEYLVTGQDSNDSQMIPSEAKKIITIMNRFTEQEKKVIYDMIDIIAKNK